MIKTSYFCDICGKEISPQEADSISLEINLDGYRPSDKYNFVHTCLECREKISHAIDSIIDTLTFPVS